jgi:hypothetical protein
VSVADLLTRHGNVPGGQPGPAVVPAPRRPLSGRMRRTLFAVGSVLAAGSVLGGAVVVSTTGHSTPLSRTPGELFEQPAPAEGDAGAPDGSVPRRAATAPVTGPAANGQVQTSAIPAPQAAPGPAAGVISGSAPAAGTGRAPVVTLPTGGGSGSTAAGTTDPGGTGAGSGAGSGGTDRGAAAPAATDATPQAPAAADAPAADPTGTAGDSSGGSGDGVLGVLGKAVGGLLGG